MASTTPRHRHSLAAILLSTCLLVLAPGAVSSPLEALPDAIDAVRPSVVGIGTYQRTRSPSTNLEATGFVIADGRHVVTNAHAIPDTIDHERGEQFSVFVGQGREGSIRRAETVARDDDTDLAIVRFEGDPLEPLTLGDASTVREGDFVAFTGYPIGLVLGLYPATHRGIVSAITPLAVPAGRGRELDARTLRRLRDSPPGVFQLDATAYPGNSGSPLYNPVTREVVGVINRTFVQESRERVLSHPSGISYAVPVDLLDNLLDEADLR
ncbi:S1C family serine protease [Aquisalimonas asiatica]|uniref:Trypsin-like peptidase domain-containing protein n=1 Tax=Aquisalimonas asiatica TaxID=406100 RepID=A0A1H8U3S2_9GAMM|nr:serine protease [Aquisalimonas asiatica]SEO97493.1 Trypsin-like peptidase domain-containing protein [Aquisalimonas asiatica]